LVYFESIATEHVFDIFTVQCIMLDNNLSSTRAAFGLHPPAHISKVQGIALVEKATGQRWIWGLSLRLEMADSLNN